MALLSRVKDFIFGLPWGQIAILIGAIGGIVFVVHMVEVYGKQSQLIDQLKADIQTQQQKDQEALIELKTEYQKNTEALTMERDNALEIAKSTQQQLDMLSNTPQKDDADISPVLSNTLDWLRQQHAGNSNSGRKSKTP
ncbi:MAG: hypothetical protein KGL39_11660 [Patescibacteria group bacterium]|nr:hypothetical protein [Patescibacteria group bacterium]